MPNTDLNDASVQKKKLDDLRSLATGLAGGIADAVKATPFSIDKVNTALDAASKAKGYFPKQIAEGQTLIQQLKKFKNTTASFAADVITHAVNGAQNAVTALDTQISTATKLVARLKNQIETEFKKQTAAANAAYAELHKQVQNTNRVHALLTPFLRGGNAEAAETQVDASQIQMAALHQAQTLATSAYHNAQPALEIASHSAAANVKTLASKLKAELQLILADYDKTAANIKALERDIKTVETKHDL